MRFRRVSQSCAQHSPPKPDNPEEILVTTGDAETRELAAVDRNRRTWATSFRPHSRSGKPVAKLPSFKSISAWARTKSLARNAADQSGS